MGTPSVAFPNPLSASGALRGRACSRRSSFPSAGPSSGDSRERGSPGPRSFPVVSTTQQEGLRCSSRPVNAGGRREDGGVHQQMDVYPFPSIVQISNTVPQPAPMANAVSSRLRTQQCGATADGLVLTSEVIRLSPHCCATPWTGKGVRAPPRKRTCQ